MAYICIHAFGHLLNRLGTIVRNRSRVPATYNMRIQAHMYV